MKQSYMFHPAAMEESAYAMRDEMLPEMGRHFSRWGNTSPFPGFIGRANNVPEWEAEIENMLSFNDSRLVYARNHIEEQFSLVKQVDVTLNVIPAGAGTIKISTITPESLPWTGVYFDGVPVTITATAKPGYEFEYWAANNNLAGNAVTRAITLNVDSSDTFTAHFKVLENNLSAYPNPFGNQLTVNYQLQEAAQVGIKLYTVMGQEIAEIVSPDSFKEAGSYTVNFDANSLQLAQGVYFIELRTKDYVKMIKLVKAKVN